MSQTRIPAYAEGYQPHLLAGFLIHITRLKKQLLLHGHSKVQKVRRSIELPGRCTADLLTFRRKVVPVVELTDVPYY